MDPALVIALLAGLGVTVAMAVGLRQMGWLGGEKRHMSSGIATGLATINEVLQPQLPRIEQIERLREGEDEDGDEQGDPPVPGR
jgi:hypothetical protein